jgi:hypothetical protein
VGGGRYIMRAWGMLLRLSQHASRHVGRGREGAQWNVTFHQVDGLHAKPAMRGIGRLAS